MDKIQRHSGRNSERTNAEVQLITELRKAEQNFGTGISLQDFRNRHQHKKINRD